MHIHDHDYFFRYFRSQRKLARLSRCWASSPVVFRYNCHCPKTYPEHSAWVIASPSLLISFPFDRDAQQTTVGSQGLCCSLWWEERWARGSIFLMIWAGSCKDHIYSLTTAPYYVTARAEHWIFSSDYVPDRCVVMVGMPYPNIKSPGLQEKMSYMDKHLVNLFPGGKMCQPRIESSNALLYKRSKCYLTVCFFLLAQQWRKEPWTSTSGKPLHEGRQSVHRYWHYQSYNLEISLKH